jgi:murein DD-endopeptidase MepM/ murein hydrolase activator NlpD
MSESYAEQYALENWGPSWSPLAGEAVHLMNVGVQVAHGNVHGALADATLHTSKRLIEAGHSAFKFYEEYNAAKDAGARAEAAQALLDLRAAYRSTGDPDTRRILLAQIETVSRAAYGEQFARTAVERLETVTTQQATGNEQMSRPLDPATRPEQPAPVFQPAPWENRLPLFPQDTNGTISQGYGWWDLYGETDFHEGIDVVVPAGTEVRSVTGGEVAVVRNSDNPAMTGIVIRNGNMTYTYWHVTPERNLTSGTSVSTGTPIGQVAAWHHPDGRDRTHLHYAVHRPPEDALGLRSDLNSQSPL